MKTTICKSFSRLVHALVIIFFLPFTAYAEEVVGTWCDQAVPTMPELDHVLEIVKTDEGKIELRMELQDESLTTIELHQISSGQFQRTDIASKDTFRIITISGNLQLSDVYGPIRQAFKLDSQETKEACLEGKR